MGIRSDARCRVQTQRHSRDLQTRVPMLFVCCCGRLVFREERRDPRDPMSSGRELIWAGRAAGFENASLGQSQLPWGAGGEIAADVLSPRGVGAGRGSWRPEEAPAGCRVRWGETGGLQVPSRPGAPGTLCSGLLLSPAKRVTLRCWRVGLGFLLGAPLHLLPGAPHAAARLGPLRWEGCLGPCAESELSSHRPGWELGLGMARALLAHL